MKKFCLPFLFCVEKSCNSLHADGVTLVTELLNTRCEVRQDLGPVYMKKSCLGKKGHHERVKVSVILLPLRPASPTLKNPQRRKIILGMRPVGSKVRSIDRSERKFFRNILFV